MHQQPPTRTMRARRGCRSAAQRCVSLRLPGLPWGTRAAGLGCTRLIAFCIFKYGRFCHLFAQIIIIGAGVNAMIAAVWLKNYAHFDNFTILERNENFAGTWWSNKYPGLSWFVFPGRRTVPPCDAYVAVGYPSDIPATLYQVRWHSVVSKTRI